jgi:hypothetical protein
MNRPLRQVLFAYFLCMLLACVYVPWAARPEIPTVTANGLSYSLLWRPPHTFGYRHELATGRILREIASLTAVLLLAACRLGEKRAAG